PGNPANTKVSGIDIDATTIPQLQQLMNARRIKAVQLVNFYKRRIRQLNPALKAVIAINPRAHQEALAADAARRRGDRRPLLGIPIIVKDNINTTGMPTTAGSWALAGSTPADAFIVERLRAAGAIILGKANLSEWANFRSSPSSSGWSGIGGQGAMPYVLDRNPCGSSSGSAVVAAASHAVAAVGTETDGSIVCPAGANGIVGIKPTLGLWSREGIVPISADQDTAGPMARNVTDAAVLLGAATGVDDDDPATRGQVGKAFTDYTQLLSDRALEGKRIGVWWEGTTFDPDVAAVLEPFFEEHVIEPLERAGATVVEGADIRPLGRVRPRARRPPLRVQDGHRVVPAAVREREEPGDRPAVPADARRAHRLQPGVPGARGSLERRHLRARGGDGWTGCRLRERPRSRHAAGPAGNRRAPGRSGARRHRRLDERAGVADQLEP
ncbi:MAG: amidase family protein, partial [Gaiellaceae bacterium]|nr:amidase family protein [Gaiellaceae bacterium]